MTHDILQSDIDLAQKLLDEHRPANEIVEALSYRGIESNRATQLVADLAAGKKVEPDKPIKINLPSNPIQKATATPESKSVRRTGASGSQVERSRSKGKTNGLPWFTILGLSSAVVCITAFVLISRRAHESVKRNESSDKSGTVTVRSEQEARLQPMAISVEAKPGAVLLCGKSVNRENFLPAIFETLGAPTRTNQVENAEQTIYAYDPYGLLVCSPKNSGHRSIVLDFDGTDGAAGTRNAFIGVLKVGAQSVQSSTDAASLGLIKGLELQTPKSASGIFRAEFGSLELVFGYLKTPERLSLVEIDF